MSRSLTLLSAAALLLVGATACDGSRHIPFRDLNCIDLDEDGAMEQECSQDPDSMVDCNDDPEADGELETPLAETAELDDPTQWYDGLDNDCSFAGSGTEHDVLDADGDGFPGIAFDDWTPHGGAKAWPLNLSKAVDAVDCDDTDASVFLDAVDGNCGRGLDD